MTRCEAERRLLAEIVRHVGKPCPTNDYFAARVGVGDTTLQEVMSRLKGKQLIVARRVGGARIITVVETGAETLPSLARSGQPTHAFDGGMDPGAFGSESLHRATVAMYQRKVAASRDELRGLFGDDRIQAVAMWMHGDRGARVRLEA